MTFVSIKKNHPNPETIRYITWHSNTFSFEWQDSVKNGTTSGVVKDRKVSLNPPAKKDTSAQRKVPPNKQPKPFPIVGFGASAGGIQAFITVLKHLDPTLGMAYVLVMHLSPNYKSALAEILRSKTAMPVQTVKNGMEVKANNVYVIPPNTLMSLVDGHLKLASRSLTTLGNFGIDYFLTTLASVYKNNAIGVILSGTATDGTLGLKAIKAEGGIAIAQDESAEFNSMPRAAFASGNVDFRLSPEGIANELAQLVKIPYTILPPNKVEAKQVKDISDQSEDLKKVLSIVKNKTGLDFFLHYKQASIYRRVMRRMVLNKIEQLSGYAGLLRSNPKEIDALYADFLINVTKFFRDPEFYSVLIKEVFPSIIKRANSIEPIRIWVAGCATGEEAYSIAICLVDFLVSKELTPPIQIFASDLDAHAIEQARIGIYSASGVQDIPPAQLKSYFKKVDGHYQVIKSIREICIFSQHNLLKDPPFSRMDLISCQNVLIYLESIPQTKIFHTFHYALKPKGYLFLGKSETIGSSTDLFNPLDKKIRLFSRKNIKQSKLEFIAHPADNGFAKPQPNIEHDHDIQKDMSRLLLSHYVYPSVVVNNGMKIVQFFGETGPYLSPIAGKASFNILKMVREDLVIDLGLLLMQARKTEQIAKKEGIRIHNKNVLQEITIEVVPKKISDDLFMLVVFKEEMLFQPLSNGNQNLNKGQKDKRIQRLETELVESRNIIRSTNEEYETTYEELQANSEEISSSNEELQSINEELESSKEELQSSNEELYTTNEELQKRNTELNESHKELKKVNEQLEQFAFISSHDLQEPLRKIQTFSSLLLTKEADLNAFAKKQSEKINSSAVRMSTLLNDLLSFSILVADQNKVIKVDLNKTIRNVILDFEEIIEKRKIDFTISVLPIILGEPIQMNQLFYNLIGNAIKFSADKPAISISSRESTPEDFSLHPELKKDTRYDTISVKDNGIGFEQKYADRIFTLFQRLQDKEDVEGTGIGLAICKKIVEDHSGFIFAEGKENVGATFTIFLPKLN